MNFGCFRKDAVAMDGMDDMQYRMDVMEEEKEMMDEEMKTESDADIADTLDKIEFENDEDEGLLLIKKCYTDLPSNL